MHISRNIGSNTAEEMMLICQFIEDFNVERLMTAIDESHFDESDVVCMKCDINVQNAKLEKQKVGLVKLSKTFNKEFATYNNKDFTTADITARRMKSGSKGIKDIFKKFTPRISSRLPEGAPEPQAIVYSSLSRKEYQLNLFGLEEYPHCVKDLLLSMIDFFNNINNCIGICQTVIDEEEKISHDKKRCLELLKNACEKAILSQRHVIEALRDDPAVRKAMQENKSLNDDTENKIFLNQRKHKTEEDFAQHGFHKFNPGEISKLVLRNAINEAGSDATTSIEQVLFPKANHDKILDIRYVIQHFDELLKDTNCKRGCIPSYIMVLFMKWCGVSSNLNLFCNYFSKAYSNNGRYNAPKAAALCSARTKLNKEKKSKGEVSKLNTQIDCLLNERNKTVKLNIQTAG